MTRTRKALIATLFAMFASLFLPDAPAQQPPAPSTEETPTPVQEVVVTGSRIAAPNEVSTSPIVVISSQSI
jgi:outer membrane cobalamin receptor